MLNKFLLVAYYILENICEMTLNRDFVEKIFANYLVLLIFTHV